MPAFNVYKFRDADALERHLQGALVSGKNPLAGYQGLVGKSLHFAKPAAQTVLFTAGPNSPTDLTFKEVKQQLEAGLAGGVLKVFCFDSRLVFIETNPSTGVEITSGDALEVLGLDSGGEKSVPYHYPDGSSAAVTPHYVNTYFDSASGQHVLIVRE